MLCWYFLSRIFLLTRRNLCMYIYIYNTAARAREFRIFSPNERALASIYQKPAAVECLHL